MIPKMLVHGALVLPLLTPAAAFAQGVAVEHEEVGCIIAGQHPKMKACFAPSSTADKRRVYFRTETLPDWYYVEMTADAPCFSGILLRPSKALIDKKLLYYVDVQGSGTGRTPEYAPIVVASEEDCKSPRGVAPLSATGPAAVFPSLPPGGAFLTAAGVSPVVVGAGVAAAALVAGGVKLASDDDDPPNVITTTVPVTTVPATPPPVSVPTPAPTALVVACQAAPRSGQAPLRVDFATFPNGASGVYGFQWAFGDGGESTNPNPAHTYTTAGTFNATVQVTSGGQIAACSRSIAVTTPPPPPPPPATFTLTVSLAGTGTGVVTGPGISCPGDCTETYAPGTPVSLTATPTARVSVFTGWSGDCTGAGACALTMIADKNVTARFDAVATLTFTAVDETFAECGLPRITITPPSSDCISSDFPGTTCTHTYPAGTVVSLSYDHDLGCENVCWSGACAAAPAPPGADSVCTVTMGTSLAAGARFVFGSCFASPPPAASRRGPGSARRVTGSTQLEVPDAEGQVIVNGVASAVRPGVAAMAVEGRQGANRVEAVLVRGAGRPGAWRFEFGQAALEPGSLRVVAGTVALITGDAVVFRLQGTRGERVVFTFEVED